VEDQLLTCTISGVRDVLEWQRGFDPETLETVALRRGRWSMKQTCEAAEQASGSLAVLSASSAYS
jgi:hypothetical protein